MSSGRGTGFTGMFSHDCVGLHQITLACGFAGLLSGRDPIGKLATAIFNGGLTI